MLPRPGRFRFEVGGFADAWGVVDVKRVASVADLGILKTNNNSFRARERRKDWRWWNLFYICMEVYNQEIFLSFDDPGIFSVGMIRLAPTSL
jgi:hypothetical protein